MPPSHDETDLPPTLFHVDLVAQHNKRKVLGIPRGSLLQKFIPPRVQSFKRFQVVDIEYEHAAIGAAIEGNAQGLEPLLAYSAIPIDDTSSTFVQLKLEEWK